MNRIRGFVRASVTGVMLSMALSGCGGGGGSAGPDPLLKGLIHRWQFDGDATDSVGTLNGTAKGPVTYTSAVLGKGMTGDGQTTGVTLPVASDMQFQGSFTLSAWARITAYPPAGHIWSSIIFDGDDRVGNDPYALLVGPSGQLRFLLNGSSALADIYGTMPLNQFVLVTGTYDKAAGVLSLYQNGVLIGQHTGDTTLTPVVPLASDANPGTGIGTNNNFPVSGFNFSWAGTIDDMRVYNRALSANEVLALYRQGIAIDPVR